MDDDDKVVVRETAIREWKMGKGSFALRTGWESYGQSGAGGTRLQFGAHI